MARRASKRVRRRVAVVEPHVLQRRGEVRLLSGPARLDVVHESDDIDDLIRWMGERDQTRWPHLVVAELLPLDPTGRDLQAVARLRSAGVRVLLVSSLDIRHEFHRIRAAGVDGVVSKRDDLEVFTDAVARVLAGETVITERAQAAARDDSRLPQLSLQEARVLELYVDGHSITAAAEAIGVKPDTARRYLKRIKQKYIALGHPVRTKIDLVRLAWRHGIADPDAP
ncbi:response regulator transcription factor [Microbacterium bovistercoris]|nr:response regulator transcription factor [Microbacterium bovistercoris]